MSTWLRLLRRKLRDSGRALSDGYRAGGYPDSVAGVYEVRFADVRAASGQDRDPLHKDPMHTDPMHRDPEHRGAEHGDPTHQDPVQPAGVREPQTPATSAAASAEESLES